MKFLFAPFYSIFHFLLIALMFYCATILFLIVILHEAYYNKPNEGLSERLAVLFDKLDFSPNHPKNALN